MPKVNGKKYAYTPAGMAAAKKAAAKKKAKKKVAKKAGGKMPADVLAGFKKKKGMKK